jgi:hypothetical protein
MVWYRLHRATVRESGGELVADAARLDAAIAHERRRARPAGPPGRPRASRFGLDEGAWWLIVVEMKIRLTDQCTRLVRTNASASKTVA